MSLVRFVSRLSVLEWAMLLGVAWWLFGRAKRTAPSASLPYARLIDSCVVISVLGIVGGAIFNLSWLGLIGLGAAALGVGLVLRGWGIAVGRWMRRVLGWQRKG